MIGQEQFDRMPEADALRLHDPLDDVAALLAGPQAVPHVLIRRDDERRRMIVVEGAQPQQVLAVPLQLDASRLDQPFERHFLFEPLDYRIGNARHENRPPSKNLSSGVSHVSGNPT
jgi:hypothetical protein